MSSCCRSHHLKTDEVLFFKCMRSNTLWYIASPINLHCMTHHMRFWFQSFPRCYKKWNGGETDELMVRQYHGTVYVLITPAYQCQRVSGSWLRPGNRQALLTASTPPSCQTKPNQINQYSILKNALFLHFVLHTLSHDEWPLSIMYTTCKLFRIPAGIRFHLQIFTRQQYKWPPLLQKLTVEIFILLCFRWRDIKSQKVLVCVYQKKKKCFPFINDGHSWVSSCSISWT